MKFPEKNILKILSIILSIILSYFFIQYIANEVEGRNFSELALGNDTSTYFAEYKGKKIHCEDVVNADECILPYKNSKKESVILWLGNSQLHAINQMKDGDKSAPLILHEEFIDTSKYFMSFSQANANLQEHYVLYEYLRNQVQIETLILPVFFDDMREEGVRPGLLDIFTDDTVVLSLRNTDSGRGIVNRYSKSESNYGDKILFTETVQEGFETYLGEKLMEVSDLWAVRSDLDSFVWMSLYKLRNYIFNIDPSTKRRKIQARYDNNLNALLAILEISKRDNINLILYIPPIRDDFSIPYNIDDYEEFKKDIMLSAKAYGYYSQNYENIVPPESWGLKDSTSVGVESEIDFMHFQSTGHQKLAYKILQKIREIEDK